MPPYSTTSKGVTSIIFGISIFKIFLPFNTKTFKPTWAEQNSGDHLRSLHRTGRKTPVFDRQTIQFLNHSLWADDFLLSDKKNQYYRNPCIEFLAV
jgi:hypothetical protein